MSIYNPFSKNQRKARKAEKKLAELVQIKAVTLQNQYSQALLTSTKPGVGNDIEDEIIVTLTSFSNRLDNVAYTIESLMQQTLRADRLQLWLGSDKVSTKDIPINLKLLEKRGLEVCLGEKDLGPYTKYYYAMKHHPNSLILTVDDDIFYPQNMIEKLYRAYLKDKATIHCHRGHKIRSHNGNLLPYKEWEFSTKLQEASLHVFPTGVGGVLYFPGSLDEAVLDSESFLTLCPGADDVWLKAMSLRRGTECKTIQRLSPFVYEFPNLPFSQEVTLKRSNKKTGGNDDKIKSVFQHYSLYEKL